MKRDENQNVGCRESWHDKCLEWICGYTSTDKDFLQEEEMRIKEERT